MTDFAQKLTDLKRQLERAKEARAQAQATLKAQENRKAEIEDEIRQLGVEPEHLDAEIERLRAEVKEQIAQAEALIPAEYRG